MPIPQCADPDRPDGTDSPYESGKKFADNYSLTRTRPGPPGFEA